GGMLTPPLVSPVPVVTVPLVVAPLRPVPEPVTGPPVPDETEGSGIAPRNAVPDSFAEEPQAQRRTASGAQVLKKGCMTTSAPHRCSTRAMHEGPKIPANHAPPPRRSGVPLCQVRVLGTGNSPPRSLGGGVELVEASGNDG